MDSNIVTIQTYGIVSTGNRNLISTLEANFDLDFVTVERSEYAIRSIQPLEIIIGAATGALLEKLILKPAIDAIAEKFDWKKAIAKYRNPHIPFKIVINLSADDLVISTDPDLLSQKHIENVWETISNTLMLLKEENLYDKIRKIRLVSQTHNELFIVCHEGNKPSYVINLDKKQIIPIDDKTKDLYGEFSSGANEFSQRIEREIDRYRKYSETILSDDNSSLT